MCGIAGLVLVNPGSMEGLSTHAERMARAIYSRGPDDSGVWTDARFGIAFSHRRLSIVDLSPAGHQPMSSADNRLVITFNGEIYNHKELRHALKAEGLALNWRGQSDTETLLAAFMHWGVEHTMPKLVGMFAFALWDSSSQTLTLARDRFGEKPLYFGWMGRGEKAVFAFASELKAFKTYPGFAFSVNPHSLEQFLRFNYIPAPLSIYQNIYKLEPGTCLTIQGRPPAVPPSIPPRAGATHDTMQFRHYWSLRDLVEKHANNHIVDEHVALDRLEKTLFDAVKLQSLADVPLGAFLSGGVDSSTIVALMQMQTSIPVKTFTIGFNEMSFDESPYAKAVANYLGTDHHELIVNAADAREVITQLPHFYDEPFGDSSQIPTHLVSKAARQNVTVALSGDAGDELFGGYNRYFWGPRIWSKVAWLPRPVRRFVGKGLQTVDVETYDSIGKMMGSLHRGATGLSRIGDKVHKLAQRMEGIDTDDDLFMSLVTLWSNPASVMSGAVAKNGRANLPIDDDLPHSVLRTSEERMMFKDSVSYLPDDILCKVDRAAMACSLETRAPFLDHRVVELAWQLPPGMKVRGNVGKWALRQILYKYVPRHLIERPKSGFGLPISKWLRNELREWGESLLDEQRMRRDGYLNPGPIIVAWKQHVDGTYDHASKLWGVLMFQAWLEANRP